MAGPWEQYQQPAPSEEAAGPWTKYQAPAQPEQKKAEPINAGEKQSVSDEARVAKERGAIPDELKTAYYSAGEMGGFSVPTYISAMLEQKKGQTFTDALKEKRDFVEALQRQNPKSSMAGSAVGLVGGVLTPLGPLGAAGAKAAQLAGKVGFGPTGKAIASGATVGSGLGAVSGGLEKYGTDEFTPGEIAKSSLYGAIGGGALTPVAEKLVGKFVSSPSILAKDAATGAAKLTDKGMEETRAILGTRFNDAQLQALEPHLAEAYSKTGGVSEAGINQALLKAHGIEQPSRAMVTGTVTPEAAEVAKASKETAQQKALDIAEGMKNPDVEREAAIRALHGEERARVETGQKNFEDQKAMEGIFQPFKIPVKNPETGKIETHNYGLSEMIFPEVKKSILEGGHPQNFETAGLDKTKQAYNYLQDVFVGNQLPYGGEVDVKNIMKVRNVLNKFYHGAEGNDFSALGAVIGGYDNAINKALDAKLFTGNSAELAKAKDANNAFWKKYREDFYPKSGEEKAKWNGILSNIKDPNTGFVVDTLTPGMEHSGQYAINNAIVNEKSGQNVYDRFKKALGPNSPGMDTLNASIRNNMFKYDENLPVQKQLKQIADNIEAHLRPSTLPITLQAFGAKEGDAAATAAAQARIAEVKNLGEAIRVINASPESEVIKQGKIMSLFRNAILPATGALVGLPHGAPTSLVGYILGGLGATLKKNYSSSSEIAAERAGAPKVMPEGAGGQGVKAFGLPYPVYPGPRNISAIMPPDEKPNYQSPPTGLITRATGGRVTTSNQLMAAMERAGKKDVQSTKPLLQSTDTAVAKALEIANQHI